MVKPSQKPSISSISSEHQFIDMNKKKYYLYVVTDYEWGTNNSIIINESATGDGGVTYFNGRMQESIPINGVLLGNNRDDVNAKKDELLLLSDKGDVIEFISPYINKNRRTNKFFIQNLKFTLNEGKDDELAFTCTITEYREANVNTIQQSLVSYDTAELLIATYNQRVGNL